MVLKVYISGMSGNKEVNIFYVDFFKKRNAFRVLWINVEFYINIYTKNRALEFLLKIIWPVCESKKREQFGVILNESCQWAVV